MSEYKSMLKHLKSAQYIADEDYYTKFWVISLNSFISSEKFKRIVTSISIGFIVCLFAFINSAHSASRIKDIVYFEGIRENTLIGYGLVVGLNGTGDNLKNSPFTQKGLEQFLSKLGLSTKDTNLKTKNVATVTITGNLPPFARSGSKFDVTVSTMGDAKSLEGGILLAAPLLGADGNVYAVAQGQVTTTGLITNRSDSNASSKGVPTSGLISSGAVVENEINFNLSSMSQLKLALRNPDISTARRVAEAINDSVGEEAATPVDPGTVELKVPEIYGNNVLGLLADVEQLVIEPDQIAKVVVDESSGTVVIGEEVKIDTVAVAQGNLMVTITSHNTDNSKEFLSDESNETSTSPVFQNNEPGNGLAVVRQGANLRDLVTGLNALGVGTRDLITILQTIKVAGALHANIETR